LGMKDYGSVENRRSSFLREKLEIP
jgi:hypothetical protein